jgi:putative endonuclease
MENYYVYILKSQSAGRYYIGHTHDLTQRIGQHNTHTLSGSASTKRLKGPWELVYSEEYPTRTLAMTREKELKSWKSSTAIERFILAQSDRVPTEPV